MRKYFPNHLTANGGTVEMTEHVFPVVDNTLIADDLEEK